MFHYLTSTWKHPVAIAPVWAVRSVISGKRSLVRIALCSLEYRLQAEGPT